MADRPEYSFGEINTDTVGRWLHLAPDEDGPIWMLNLMKYRAVADYGEEGGPAVSGKDADDAYAPVKVLEDIGAMIAVFGDVTRQVDGEPAWDRIAVVRYPTRHSFFAMQERDDFKKKYVHKKAGMEFTIIMGCLPDPVSDASGSDDPLVLRVRRFAAGATPGADPDGLTAIARFGVDGVVIGDRRTWDEARFDRVPEGALEGLRGVEGVEEQVIVVVDPLIDAVADSVTSATSG